MSLSASPITGDANAILGVTSSDPSLLTAGDSSNNVYTVTLVIAGTPALTSS